MLASSGQMAALCFPRHPSSSPLPSSLLRRPAALLLSARRRGYRHLASPRRRPPRGSVLRCAAAPSGSTLQYPVRRKCSPLLESALLPGGNDLTVHEWKAVPDIWRTAAEKYADRVALVDPYHEPPSELTYKQLEQEILDFSQGLRAVGVAPDEKLALFADNSCRWLVADQEDMPPIS